MNEWARLVDRYAFELKKYELVCSFCGQQLSDGNVNTECADNSHAKDLNNNNESQQDNPPVYFTEDVPEQSLCGNRRHWFAKPSSRTFKLNTSFKNNDQEANNAFANGMQVAEGKTADFLRANPSLAATVSRMGQEIASKTHLEGYLNSGFRQVDKEVSGTVPKDALFNIVFDNFKDVRAADLVALLTTFTSEYDENSVNYEDFMRLVGGGGSINQKSAS